MNTKNTILLLVVALAVLGAIYYTKQKEEREFTSAAIPEKTIPAVTSGTVETIIIDAPDQDEVTLTKADGTWYTNVEKQYEADQNAVNAALRALAEPVSASVVSTNPDSFDDYQVSETSGTSVKIIDHGKSDPALEMIIGKDGPSASSTYVRLADSDEVLNARASLSMSFKRPDGWRDKQIFDFPGSSATRIEETGSSATFTLVKSGEDKWTFEDQADVEAESARVDSLANMLASLRANQFVDPTEAQTLADFGLEPPRQQITLTYDDKSTSPSKPTTVTLLIGKEALKDGEWYAKRANKNDIFTFGSHVVESLSPDAESIKVTPPEPEPAPEPEPDTTATTAAPVASSPAPATDDSDTTATEDSNTTTTGATANTPGDPVADQAPATTTIATADNPTTATQ